MVTNIEKPVHHRFSRSTENIPIVSENVADDSIVSIQHHPQELGLFYAILLRILHLDPAYASTEVS